MVIYRDNIGIIEGYRQANGYWHIVRFEVFPEHRGNGLAYQLAKHIPQQATLIACSDNLSKNDIVRFYKKLGFEQTMPESAIMSRGAKNDL